MAARVIRLSRPASLPLGRRDQLVAGHRQVVAPTVVPAAPAPAGPAFGVEFACCWDDVACEEDSGLTADAQQLKAALLDIVRRVEDL